MSTVTVSPKYQIVIPPDVRRRMNLQPGDKLMVVEFNGGLLLLPLVAPASLRGISRGINPAVPRDSARTDDTRRGESCLTGRTVRPTAFSTPRCAPTMDEL
jgi:AbrB family looped-hinge helix DNA binding protein